MGYCLRPDAPVAARVTFALHLSDLTGRTDDVRS